MTLPCVPGTNRCRSRQSRAPLKHSVFRAPGRAICRGSFSIAVRRGTYRPVSISTAGDTQPIGSLRICGAGYLPHRFKQGKGFEQPPVYCKDLWKLISHISSKMADEYKAKRFSMSADKQAPTIM